MYLIDPKILEVFTVIEHINVGTGIICNIILLYLVRKFSRASMGTYKYLLIIFASYDIFLTCVHGTINHQVVIVNLTTFAANMTSFYCASFTVPFTLMIIHFLYRYWAIKCPDRIILFSQRPFMCLCASFSASGFVTWYCLCVFGLTGAPSDASTIAARAEYFRRYNRNVTDSYLIAEHWKDGNFNLRPALVLLCFDSIIFGCITLASSLCILTLHHIAKAQTISAYSKYLHQKLLKTLIAQTALPVILVYIPYFCILTLPFLAIPDYGLTSACTAFNSAFPAVDAIIVIALMKDYRVGLASIVTRRSRRTTTVSSGGMTTKGASK
ncbi:hypothetical protein PRIPAC_82029 [Pristionchus pacificus]|uniref:G protein-coupled receptor n=1 Tax=Pristionchus pacificus TaxID=54126 RepID=A0A2A6C3I5_PRIPA|nr:hypothetical protein PRIPAC_82029 [Pristionchus pacificus]|eukprot:PDM72734.1 G protein-coupled receptor [Pristionchus pacificus]